MLNFLYNTFLGRLLLKMVCKPAISRFIGVILDSKMSLIFVPSFVKKHKINMSDYLADDFKSFNDFFMRKIKPGLRPFDEDENAFCSPCDGMLSVYSVSDGTVLPIKQSEYTIEDLLNNRELSAEFKDGLCLVFRLCVNNYHRYSYFDDGIKGENIFIPGLLHTVRPLALEKFPVFVRNCREYTVMETKHFGKCIQVEVGALLVGKIANEHGACDFEKGSEKGHFEYGGSTIIVLMKNDQVELCEKYNHIFNTCAEIPVKMGEKIGVKSE